MCRKPWLFVNTVTGTVGRSKLLFHLSKHACQEILLILASPFLTFWSLCSPLCISLAFWAIARLKTTRSLSSPFFPIFCACFSWLVHYFSVDLSLFVLPFLEVFSAPLSVLDKFAYYTCLFWCFACCTRLLRRLWRDMCYSCLLHIALQVPNKIFPF